MTTSRGFVFTVYALLFFSLLLSYAIGWLTFSGDVSYQFSEKSPARVVSGLLDNASSAFSTVYPFNLSTDTAHDRVIIAARMDDYNSDVLDSLSLALDEYATGIPGLSFSLSNDDWPDKQEVSISSNASFYRVSDGVDVNWVLSDAGASDAFSRLDENVHVNGDLNGTDAWSWNPSGDVAVNIVYKDDSITLPLSGRLDSSQVNQYTFYLTDGSTLALWLYREENILFVKTVVDSSVTGDINMNVDSESFSTPDLFIPSSVEISYGAAQVNTNLPYQSVAR